MILEMSLGDVAALARVRRPVVSTWRTRSTRSAHPFPQPCSSADGRARFDVDEVVAWLEATKHGNHDDVRRDAPAYAAPRGLDLTADERLFDGLTALLCLKGLADEVLATGDVAALARRLDADDDHVLCEVLALGDDLSVMAAYADELSEAAFGSAAALERLLSQRFRLRQTGLVREALQPEAVHLVRALISVLGRDRLVDVSATSGDLLVPLPTSVADVVLRDDARLARRRLLAAGVVPERLTSLEDVGSAVALAVDPTADELDELVVSLGESQRAVVLGPAAHLVGRLSPSADQRRAQSLRAGRLRALVHLPAGLVTARSRERLALWVLGPDLSGRAMEDRVVAVADLADGPLTSLVVAQLIDDVHAAMAGPDLMRARTFAVARLVRTSTLLAHRGGLHTVVAPRRAMVAAPERRALPVSASVMRVTTNVRQPVTVEEAERVGALRVLAGNRLDLDAVADGVTVLGVEELLGAAPSQVDRLAFLAMDRARLTEPGDVVFCTSPRPRALVDLVGGSAVRYPARVLRLLSDDLSPHVIAHAISSLPETSRAWKRWSLPRIAPDQGKVAEEALAALESEQLDLRRRLAELDHSRDVLVLGLVTGTYSVTVAQQKDT